jgi:sugar phosphate isomerase/epimerase
MLPSLRWSVSSWSVRQPLGQVHFGDDPDHRLLQRGDPAAAELTLLELPAAAAEHGVHTLELCHFHLPRTDDAYLAQLRQAADTAGVELYSILIDCGDLTHPGIAERRAAVDRIGAWVGVAGRLGVRGVRVDPGRSGVNVDQTVEGLGVLLRVGDQVGIRVFPENWHSYGAEPHVLLQVLDRLGEGVGLCVDFGNAEQGPDKYDTISRLMPRATSLHVKPRLDDHGRIDEVDLSRSLKIARANRFTGPASLIADGWDAVVELKKAGDRLLAQPDR